MPGFAAVSGPAPTAFTPGIGPVGPMKFDTALPGAATGNLANTPPHLFESAAQTLFVRKTGSDSNGGSSLAVVATGTDGVTNGSTTFTSASGAFDSTYLNDVINIVGAGRFRIVAVQNATTLTLSSATGVTATGQTWTVGGAVLTIGSLLSNMNEAVREGDTIYVGGGTYRETVLVNLGPHYNAGAVVSVVGDTDGSHTGDAGMVQLTAYTTDDKTVPSTSPTVTFRSGVSLFSFSNIFFVSGLANSNQGQIIHAGAVAAAASFQATTMYLSFTGCTFQSGGLSASAGRLITANVDNGRPLNWTFDRCLFLPAQSHSVWFLVPLPLVQGGADVDLNVLVENCVVIGGTNCFSISAAAGTATYKIGGVRLKNITSIGATTLLVANSATQHSTTVPCTLTNSVAMAGSSSSVLNAQTGTITEDYNVIQAVTPRTNVTVGAHSISDFSYMPLLHFGQEQQWGAMLRQFGEPMSGSPLLGFGNDTTQTAYDLRNQIRPAGGGNALPAVGALERSNTFAKETGTVHTGTNAISATGPAYQDFLVPVTASTSYTFSVYVNYDGSYTGTKPQMLILNGGEAGVTDQTVTAGGSAGGGWVQITATLFSPTSNGIVTVRFQSNDTSGVSKTVFDTFAVT